MTKLLDRAIEAARRLPPEEQDAIAQAIMELAGEGLPVALSPEEHQAITRSQEAAACGEFASDDEVRAVWAKYGL